MPGLMQRVHLLCLSLILQFFFHTSLAEFNPICTKDTYFPPRCTGGKDPITGEDCGEYGYDCTWTVTERSASGWRRLEVNSNWPPPAIHVTKGQRIRIALVNKLEESVTLHFHGLLMERGYTIMDGPQHLTQAGVKNEVFVYDFPAEKAGTYWIHSHAPGQYPKGLRSPLIITDPAEPGKLGYSSLSDGPNAFDKVVALSDHYQDFWEFEKLYNNGTCGDGLEPPPQAQLFNDESAPTSPGMGAYDRQKVNVKPNTRYRVRFINMSAFSRYYIWMEGNYDMEVIEIDGVTLKPGQPGETYQLTKGIELASGQRVSVIVGLEATRSLRRIMVISDRRINAGFNDKGEACKLKVTNSQLSDMQYTWGWLVNTDTNPGSSSFNAPDSTEMASYGTSSRPWVKSWDQGEKVVPFYKYRPKLPFVDDQRRTDGNLNPLYAWNFNEAAFRPYDDIMAWIPTDYSSTYVHEITIDAASNGEGVMGLGNPKKFTPPDKQPGAAKRVNTDDDWPKLPTLLRALYDTNFNSRFVDPGYYSYNQGEVSQTLVMPESNEVHWFAFRSKVGDHPIHMHGHEFQIIAKLPAQMSGSRTLGFNEEGVNYRSIVAPTYPSRRDTIMVEKGFTVIVAIKSSNPGVWALHCHNDFHAESGMFMQLIEDPGKLRETVGRFTFAKGAGGMWNFRVDLVDDFGQKAAIKWLYQTVWKALKSYGYVTLPIYCGYQTDKLCNYPDISP